MYVGSLDEPNTRKLMEDGASPRYADGYLFYSRGTTLFARQFDAERLQFSGDEIHITDGAEDVSVSDNGAIVYRSTGPILSTLTWLDRNGHRTATLGDAGPYDQVVLSPRGRRATLVRLDTRDLWDVNLATGIFSRFTTDPAFDTDPSWAPDERALAFTSFRTGRATVFVKDLDTGKEEQLVRLDEAAAVDQWTPDGRFVVFRTFGKAVYTVPLNGDRKPLMLIDTPYVEDEVARLPRRPMGFVQLGRVGALGGVCRRISGVYVEATNIKRRRRTATVVRRWTRTFLYRPGRLDDEGAGDDRNRVHGERPGGAICIENRANLRRSQVRGQRRWSTLFSSGGIRYRQKFHLLDQLAQPRSGGRASTVGFIRTSRRVSNASYLRTSCWGCHLNAAGWPPVLFLRRPPRVRDSGCDQIINNGATFATPVEAAEPELGRWLRGATATSDSRRQYTTTE